jgi:hypothetical protein
MVHHDILLHAYKREDTHMQLREFFSEDAVELELKSDSKDDILRELIGLLGLDENQRASSSRCSSGARTWGLPASVAASPSPTAARWS